ncbi:MAG TPA: HNH endonuclease [Burkholderiales bacterium]|nr:HNH endonuclease [Burkholderiales bacterium]
MPRSIARPRSVAFDRQRGRCFYCEYPMWLSDIEHYSSLYHLSLAQANQHRCTAEHLQARQDGGGASRSNIVAACLICNRRRHARRRSMTPEVYRNFVQSRLRRGRWHVHPLPPNSALLTDAFSSLRCACGAAKRGR